MGMVRGHPVSVQSIAVMPKGADKIRETRGALSLLLTHTILYAPRKPGEGRGVQSPHPPWGREGAGCWPILLCLCSQVTLAAGPISPLVSKLQKCLLTAVAEITVAITVSWWHQALDCWKASLNFFGADLSGHVHAVCHAFFQV